MRLLASTDFVLRSFLKLGVEPARQLATEELAAGQALVEWFRADGGACCFAPTCRPAGARGDAWEPFLAVLDATMPATLLIILPYFVGDAKL